MDHEKIFQKVREVLAYEVCISENKIGKETKLGDDLKMDSLDIAEFLIVVEEEFDINFSDESQQEMKTRETVDDVASAIEGLLAKKA